MSYKVNTMRILIHRDAGTVRHRTPSEFDAASHFDDQAVNDRNGFHVYDFVDCVWKLAMPGEDGRVCVHSFDILFALNEAVSRSHLVADRPTVVITKLPPSDRCGPARARSAMPVLKQDLVIWDMSRNFGFTTGILVSTPTFRTRVLCARRKIPTAHWWSICKSKNRWSIKACRINYLHVVTD